MKCNICNKFIEKTIIKGICTDCIDENGIKRARMRIKNMFKNIENMSDNDKKLILRNRLSSF